MKILVVGPSWVGDMIMAQTLFKALKKNYNATIDVLAPKWSLPVVARIKEINQAIEMPIPHGKLKLLYRYKLGKALRAKKYDLAIVLPNSWKAALIPFWAKIPVRTGWFGEMRFGLLNDIRRLNKKAYPKMIERFVALAYPKDYKQPFNIQNPTLLTNTENTKNALKDLKLESYIDANIGTNIDTNIGTNTDTNIGTNIDTNINTESTSITRLSTKTKIMAICPGASYGKAKCWPSAHYAEVIQAKINAGWKVWLFGSQADKKITDEIVAMLNNDENIVNLAGRINLLETIDLLSIVTVVITNDSGLMHIAAALAKPIVAIYGSTTPSFTPPLTDNAVILEHNDLPCRPCFKRECPYGHYLCMTSIKAAAALKAIDTLLNNNILKSNVINPIKHSSYHITN